MHASLRQRWVAWLIAASSLTCATSEALAQESRDWNVRRAYDDGRTTVTTPDSPFTSKPTTKQSILPLSFRSRIDSPTQVVRGNGSANPAPLPLAPPKERKTLKSTASTPPSAKGSATTIISSLAIVLGAFFLVAWFARCANPHSTAILPKEVVETLGRTSMGNRQFLQLVRIGNKLLLLAVSPTGTETLTEITSADEVERLTGLCQQHQPGSVTTTFRGILAQLGTEPTTPGFLGDAQDDDSEPAHALPGRRSRARRREEDHD